jgi:glycosyltransferase involved in cell wall biosynthesis
MTYKKNMEKNEKIGCALITSDRPNFYKRSLVSLISAAQTKNIEYVVVNDGKDKLPHYPINFIETSGKKGVAYAKNLGLKFLLENGCKYLFLMEDDIEIKDISIFEKYIETSKKTGIKHFNYAGHGNHNRDQFGKLKFRKIVKYPNKTSIVLYSNVLGAFSFYDKIVLDEIGLFDESFYNALEHVDHTYQASLKNYTTPFRWFCDIIDSEKSLHDILPDHQQSVIRNENFQEIFKNGLDIFIKKNGFSVVHGYGPPEPIISENDCMDVLKEIYEPPIKN